MKFKGYNDSTKNHEIDMDVLLLSDGFRLTGGAANTKLTIEMWPKDCRLRTFGLLFCMKIFGASELTGRSTFSVDNQSYSVRTSYTRRQCADYHLLSSTIADYIICVVTCPMKQITRVFQPIPTAALLPRKTGGASSCTQKYDTRGFTVHDQHQLAVILTFANLSPTKYMKLEGASGSKMCATMA